MSLGIAFKGPEGIVLAADSRVTLFAKRPAGDVTQIMPATFDNATKLLRVNGQDFVGTVTYGLGAIGREAPSTAHSFIPEFEAKLAEEGGGRRLETEAFCRQLSAFFMAQWRTLKMPEPWPGESMIFLIGGYNEGEPYGRVFEFMIPSRPDPVEQHAQPGQFGMTWGGQREFVDRLLQGFSAGVPHALKQKLNLADEQVNEINNFLKESFSAQIPYPFLPLQDCVDLAIFLIKTTISMQRWTVDVRGVGGAVDVATITRMEGFKAVQQKVVRGE